MYRIALLNMPFAALNFPSLALTQLKSVVDQRHAGRVDPQVHYLHHEFGRLIGIDDYQRIANEGEHFVSGVGDWLFRQVAFPDAEDNTEDYLLRYYPRNDARSVRFKQRLGELRGELEGFLEGLIDQRQHPPGMRQPVVSLERPQGQGQHKWCPAEPIQVHDVTGEDLQGHGPARCETNRCRERSPPSDSDLSTQHKRPSSGEPEVKENSPCEELIDRQHSQNDVRGI